MSAYAELDVRSNFSFLEGGSHAGELVDQAKALGLAAIGVADRNTLAGVVRAHAAAKACGLRLLIGCRLVFIDGAELIVYPRDRSAYGRLCRLLSIGKSGIEGWEVGAEGAAIAKGECHLRFEQAAALGEGMIALAPAPGDIDEAFETKLASWRAAWPDDLYLAASSAHRGDDRARLGRLAAVARRTGAPMVATNAVLYHHHERRRLQDVLTCIREKTTIDEAGFRLQANAERFLKPPEEMARLFKGHEIALTRTLDVVRACRFSLDELSYIYPDEPVPPGKTPDEHLRNLALKGAEQRYPSGIPTKILALLEKELTLIEKVRYAPYFLTVHDIVAWAREPGREILCQGRGSAANSVVCFCLGVTSVDPTQQDVLFERFISEERSEPPDIDVDFEHERREEVMQYVYQRYGRHRAAICATVIHYRPRSAIRDVGKALGLTEDVTAQLANTVWGSYGAKVEDGHVDATGLRREDPRLKLALELTEELIRFPRHLSQHVGGFVLTQGPLTETVPIGNAAMDERTFIEWDKDDIDELKIMKVDVLALGMLTAIRKSFVLMKEHYGVDLDLATLPREEPRVYDMLCKADSLGVFQVESRAQMSMLPRLRPRTFYDLVVEVAIVRPGPIQGNMVHPYLTRRSEKRAVEAKGGTHSIEFPAPSPEHGDADELKRVLGKTLGVPLFQEQAMRIAMEAAKFTGDEANGLRRAMATFRRNGTIGTYEDMMVSRMVGRGYDPEFAQNCFSQIKGFGDYGFPESHAAAFAHLVYVSAWIKWAYPEVFAAALLNSQPMGFYAPAQIVRDAKDHKVAVLHPDVNLSDWDCTLEEPIPNQREEPSAARATGNTSPRGRGRGPERSEREGEGLQRCRTIPEGVSPHPPIADAMGPSFSPQEKSEKAPRAVRLGLRQIDGFREAWALAIMASRAAGGPLRSLDELKTRVVLEDGGGLPGHALDALAAADALNSLDLTRRPGLWAAHGIPSGSTAPLFAFAGLEEADGPPPPALPVALLSEEVVHDYETIRLSLKAHPMNFLRERMSRLGVMRAIELKDAPDNARAAVAGVVLVRQRPGSAHGVVFMTLEDETGVANAIVWPKAFDRFRPVVMGARMVIVRGLVQHAPDGAGYVTHLVAQTIEDRTADLALLSAPPLNPPRSHGDGAASASADSRDRSTREHERHRHPRDVRVLPRSRDFH
jgi:error-prone DNA polymerase